jgi:hypothetical protein
MARQSRRIKGEIEFKCRKIPDSSMKQRAKQLRKIWDGNQISMFETDLNIKQKARRLGRDRTEIIEFQNSIPIQTLGGGQSS